MPESLRDYQGEAVALILRAIEEGERPLLVSPTGAGKTTIACDVIRRLTEAGKRVVFVAHAIHLVDQAAERLGQHGVRYGIVRAADNRVDVDAPVQVCSVLTLIRREAPPADVVFVDEAHRARAHSFQAVLGSYPGVPVVGLTATPYRLDGRPLGDVFSMIIETPQAGDMISEGWLVEPVVFAASRPNLRQVRTQAGDFSQHEADRVMRRLTGDIVEHCRRHRQGPAVVFATTVAHSRHLQAELTAAGVPCAHVDAASPLDERRRVVAGLLDGSIAAVSNVGVWTEGWDLPALGTAIIARPTQSRGLWQQMCGRPMRPWPGKTRAVILDHAGNVHRHGLPDAHQTYSLAGSETRTREERLPGVRICPSCLRAYSTSLDTCPDCGTVYPIQLRRLPQVDRESQLQQVAPATAYMQKASQPERLRLLSKWLAEARNRGWKEGSAAYRFRSTMGRWPTPQEKEMARAIPYPNYLVAGGVCRRCGNGNLGVMLHAIVCKGCGSTIGQAS